ncbi:hypothetical protein HN51_017801 [Arachis hypogaea]|uniref:L-2-hydroxyglutarate dehydrogenase, mitochondrial n=1 Tax=Arachis hypogaea TaxID=3818 RepID=A0A445BR81_ARAHY|nr:hypothetical protein Ahy_A08g037565 [Arachis hypogaea]
MLKRTFQSFRRSWKGFASSSSRRRDARFKWKYLHSPSNFTVMRSMMSSTQTRHNNFVLVPREKVDCLVIGAGVVGISIARALALKGREAIFCSRGRDMLYDYCTKHVIPHKQIGKLIVATRSSEIPKLNDILNHGIQNGVDSLRMIDGIEAMKMEPELQCVKAVLSPVSGIVDSHSLMLALVGEAESHRTTFTYNSAVIGGHLEGNQICVHVSETNSLKEWNGTSTALNPDLVLVPNLVVNSAGLSAPHLRKDLRACQVKFGPDVEWIDSIDDISSFRNKYFLMPFHLLAFDYFWFDYSVHANRAEQFYPEIRKYYSNLKDGSLEPGYSGIRPKLSGPSQPPVDFVVQGENIHGIPGLVNLLVVTRFLG